MRDVTMLTKEQIKKNNHYHELAMKHFGLKHGDKYVLHHKDESLKYTDIERYLEWRPEDLEVMSMSDHAKYHMTGTKHKEETIKKMQSTHSKFPVRCVETGIQYMSSQEAQRETGILHIGCASTGRRASAGGYHWERVGA